MPGLAEHCGQAGCVCAPLECAMRYALSGSLYEERASNFQPSFCFCQTRLAGSEISFPTLVGMFVDGSVRRQGIGVALVESVIGWARSRGAARLVLWVTSGNQVAIALYRRLTVRSWPFSDAGACRTTTANGTANADYPQDSIGSRWPEPLAQRIRLSSAARSRRSSRSSASAISSFSTAVVSGDLAFRKPNRSRRRKKRSQTSSGSRFFMEGKLKSCPLYSQDQSIVTGVRAGKMPSPDPTPEQLQTAIDRLLETAERCYRLARGVTDRQ